MAAQMWPKLVADAKAGGADCIETYVFWNGHETSPGKVRAPIRMSFCKYSMHSVSNLHFLTGELVMNCSGLQYYFEDRFDLVRFAKVVKDAGLYLMLRIGPFVAAEWNFGSDSPVRCYRLVVVFRDATVLLMLCSS
jgi:hypothetical protein